MNYFFLGLALLIALIDWIAVAKNWKRLEYFAKPGVMVALLAWLWQVSGFQGPVAPFAVGLLLSMAGDVFLMLPREQFIAGLVSFLLAHVAYLVGFNTGLPPVNLASLFLLLLVGIVAGQVGRGILAGLKRSGNSSLKVPVIVYAAAISLMLLSALLTLVRADDPLTPELIESWTAGAAILVSLGALLFFASDTFLAWNKFVAPLPYGKLRVIVTYHLGQILIALGVAANFLPRILQ